MLQLRPFFCGGVQNSGQEDNLYETWQELDTTKWEGFGERNNLRAWSTTEALEMFRPSLGANYAHILHILLGCRTRIASIANKDLFNRRTSFIDLLPGRSIGTQVNAYDFFVKCCIALQILSGLDGHCSHQNPFITTSAELQ